MRRRFARAIGVATLLMAGLKGSAQPSPPPGFLSQFEWVSDDPLHGGISAIEIGADGLTLTVLSDAGAFSTGTIARDATGLIARVTLAPFQMLKGREDAPLAAGRDDSEGLAIDAQGASFVSFEGAARVLRYDALSGSAENLPTPAEFKKFVRNSSLEALAIDANGTLYTLPERSGAVAKPFPIYRFKNGVWDSKLSLPRTDGFLPVGADFGPDGRIYVLMRQFNGLAGFASKLIRFTVADAEIGPVEVLFESAVGYHDNLEGVSIWRDGAGRLRATMIADNNYLPFLSSGIVEYALPD